MCVSIWGNSLEKGFSARNGTLLVAGQEEKLWGGRRDGVWGGVGGCKVKSAEPARVKGPRNSAELLLIAHHDGVVCPSAFKPPQSVVAFCFNLRHHRKIQIKIVLIM